MPEFSWALLAERLRAEGRQFASAEGAELKLPPSPAANEPRLPWCDR